MQSKNFIITELRILPQCDISYRKILQEDTYRFNQLELNKNNSKRSLEREIFGKRIIIQAIVGKNGSGKSSILEIIYRIINNFSYYILRSTKLKRTSAEPIFLIENLYADLDFIINDTLCSLLVRGRSLGVKLGEEKMLFGEPAEDLVGFSDYNDKGKDKIIELASSFFYTIVTNYSFQSLITQDFDKDVAHHYIDSKQSGVSSNGNWLDSLFRKNDGYITPIVLNPYRDEGGINLHQEYQLTLSRMSALLVQAEQNKIELLRGYRLSTIQYKANHSHFINKLFDKKKYNPLDEAMNLSEILLAVKTKGTIAREILDAYEISFPHLDNEALIIPYAYLIYKTLSVLSKYAQFDEFSNIPEITEFRNNATDEIKEALGKAISEITTFRSHVNTKIYQTLNFLRAYPVMPLDFNLIGYAPYYNKKKFKDLDDIIQHLPPPFYEQDIRLFRGDKINSDLPLSSLSSGERQFAYTISTIVYHIRNLLSIQQSGRIRYRNINIVLDEVEICFHPEYQRQFVDWLLDLIERLNLSRNCSFNILLVTHSPFILSDIPKRNILYLENGIQKTDDDLINPFAANINDILYQSFFLEGGFMGEHAKKQIISAVSAMERIIQKQKVSSTSLWDRETLAELADMIGEPLLRDNVQAMLTQAFVEPSYEERLKAKDLEIETLRNQLALQNDVNK